MNICPDKTLECVESHRGIDHKTSGKKMGVTREHPSRLEKFLELSLGPQTLICQNRCNEYLHIRRI